MKHLVTTTLALSLGASLAGCRSPEVASEPAAPAPQVAAAEKGHQAPHVTGEHHPYAAPFVLTLLPAGTSADGKRVDLTVVLESARGLKDPLDLTVKLPPGARLVEGSAVERFGELQAGKLSRHWVVESDRPFSADDPVKIAATLKPDHDAYGAHAERVWPAKPNVLVKSPAVPPPPVGRPPVPFAVRPVKAPER